MGEVCCGKVYQVCLPDLILPKDYEKLLGCIGKSFERLIHVKEETTVKFPKTFSIRFSQFRKKLKWVPDEKNIEFNIKFKNKLSG